MNELLEIKFNQSYFYTSNTDGKILAKKKICNLGRRDFVLKILKPH